jgi:hypothetical protein
MITFQEILSALKEQYSFSNCYIADNIGVEDEIVDLWEAGKAVPNAEQIRKFSECFALPVQIIQTAIDNQNKENI